MTTDLFRRLQGSFRRPPFPPAALAAPRAAPRAAPLATSVAGSFALMLVLAACTTDGLAPSDRTAGLEPVLAEPERMSSTPADVPDTLPRNAQDNAATGTSPIPQEGIDIDAMVSSGNRSPVVGLAEEQSRDIHPPAAQAGNAPPLVDGIGTNSVHVLSVPAQTYGAAQPSPARPDPGGPDPGGRDSGSRDLGSLPSEADPDLPPLTPARRAMEAQRQAQFLEQEQRVMLQRRDKAQEEQVAFLPRGGDPLSAPTAGRGAGPMSEPESTGRMPASEVACRQRLTKLGVTFKDVPRISNGPSCGIDHPIQLSGLKGGIAVKPAVKLNCEVTEAFALWVRNELAPSARYRYLSGIQTIKPMGGYSCRTMNSRRGAAMSEHAHGNAIDIGKFVLKSGKEIDVRKPGFFAFREKGLLKAVRQDSCKYFNTVLGPGSDPQHKDHFHFDLRDRKSGYRHCD